MNAAETPRRRVWPEGDAARAPGAMAIARRYALARADRFQMETDAFPGLSAWLEPLRPSIEREMWRTDNRPGNIPAPLRLGCGCAGLLLKPLFWLGIARAVPTVEVAGRATPSLADWLAMWPGPFPGPQEMHLTQAGQPLWDAWDYGDAWEMHLTAAERDELNAQLRAALGPGVALVWHGAAP